MDDQSSAEAEEGTHLSSQPSASNGERETLINTFCEITSSSRSEALFFLESHNFSLDSAVSTFLETAPAASNTAAIEVPPQPQSPSESQSYSPSESSSPSRCRSPSPPPPRRSRQPTNAYNLRSSRTANPPPASGRRGGGGIRTLADLNRESTEGSGSDSDEPQEYFTGGEKSGMLVQDPSKPNDVDSIFNQARQAGAVERSVEQNLPSSSTRSFTGTARKLSGDAVSPIPQQPVVITHNITFWSNGFTVDDGPLRELDDPANASFLESIKNSECPKELEPADRKTAVHVNLIRREGNCPVTERRHTPFHGAGRTLGSSSDTTSAEQIGGSSPLTTAPAPSMGLVVDQTLPSTSIQLRLADGTRMISRFNYHHTIRDIRGFIDASRPGGPRAYQLQTVGFPPKQLTDLDQTIEQAGLANSVVIQKF